MVGGGVADGDEVVGDVAVRETKDTAHGFFPVFMGIERGPDPS